MRAQGDKGTWQQQNPNATPDSPEQGSAATTNQNAPLDTQPSPTLLSPNKATKSKPFDSDSKVYAPTKPQDSEKRSNHGTAKTLAKAKCPQPTGRTESNGPPAKPHPHQRNGSKAHNGLHQTSPTQTHPRPSQSRNPRRQSRPMVSPQSPTRSTKIQSRRRRLHGHKNKSPIQPHQMDRRKMAHLRRQTSPTKRRHHTLPTRRSLEQTNSRRKSRNQPQKDSRLQAGQAIRVQHTSRQNSRQTSTPKQNPLKPLHHKANIHLFDPHPLSLENKRHGPAREPSI